MECKHRALHDRDGGYKWPTLTQRPDSALVSIPACEYQNAKSTNACMHAAALDPNALLNYPVCFSSVERRLNVCAMVPYALREGISLLSLPALQIDTTSKLQTSLDVRTVI